MRQNGGGSVYPKRSPQFEIDTLKLQVILKKKWRPLSAPKGDHDTKRVYVPHYCSNWRLKFRTTPGTRTTEIGRYANIPQIARAAATTTLWDKRTGHPTIRG